MEELGDLYLNDKEYLKALNCYLNALENASSTLNLKLCYLYILLKDYEAAFYYFNNSYIIENDYINIDYNLGIFLFSMLIRLPDEYLNVKNMKFKDVRILNTDIGYQNIKFQNKIRNLILTLNFKIAKTRLEEDTNQDIYNLIVKELVNCITEFQKEENNYLLELINLENYQELLDYLEQIDEGRLLPQNLTYALNLVKELLNIQNNLLIVEKVNYKTRDVFEAIDCKNYSLALELSKVFCSKNNINRNKNIIYLLLDKIVKEQKALEEFYNSDILDMDLGEILDVEELESAHKEVDIFVVENNIIKYLNANNLHELYQEIDNFLININKLNYRFLVIDMIKLASIENNFSLVSNILKDLSSNNIKFKVGEYINNFYISLDKKEYQKCRIYLDIIQNAWKLGQEFKLAFVLEKILNEYDKKDDNNFLTVKIKQKIK